MPPDPLPAEPSAVEPVEPENDGLSSKTAEPDPDWAPTQNPNATVQPGKMRSDREEIPAPFTKADADKAETLEAKTRAQRTNQRTALVADCQYYWPSPHAVCGAIRDKYNALGGPGSFLSFPNSAELTNPDGFGKRTQFLNGPIYWSAATGAHPVVNSFLNRWGIHGYEAGWLKYPTTDEIVLPDGGRRQEFQFGAIYVAFQNAIGSAIRNGPLRDKYNTVGGLAPGGTLLGYPIQDQVGLPDGQGQMDRFERGVIYWHPITGAHPVTGPILVGWELSGYETGTWGYPVEDQYDNAGTPAQIFENHVIDVNRETFEEPASGGIVYFNHGEAVDLESYGGTLNARRAASGYDTRYLGWGFHLSDALILSKAVNGIGTGMSCLTYTRREGALVQSSSKKGIPITYHYHGSMKGHDDNTLYTLNVACSFTNKTVRKNGKGVLAYGVTVADYQMAYEFLTN